MEVCKWAGNGVCYRCVLEETGFCGFCYGASVVISMVFFFMVIFLCYCGVMVGICVCYC